MRSARPDDDGKCKIGCDLGEREADCDTSANCSRVTPIVAGISRPSIPRKQAMQLVAIEIADELRRIEQRPRPARRRLVDLAQRIPAILGIRTRSR